MSLWQLMTTRRKNENGSGSVQDAEKAAQPLPPRLRPKLSEVSFLGPYKYLAEWDIALLCFMVRPSFIFAPLAIPQPMI